VAGAICALGFILTQPAAGEEVWQRPSDKAHRFDEDWSGLSDPSKRTDPFDAIKWIPLNNDKSWYLTLGGELRERFESAHNPVFGLQPPLQNSYLLQRAVLLADLHLGQNVRTFVELVSGLAPGWNGTPPPIQQDELDVLQAFTDLSLPAARGDVTLRAGRQEMSFGSQRLVSVRESPNVRLAFDGVRSFWTGPGGVRVDAFAVRPVAPQLGVFNDSSDPTQAFWGVYATGPVWNVPGLNIDLYYLGLDRQNAQFAQGTANEHRQTLGTRLFGRRGGFDWDAEAAFQFGSFGSADIRAWTVSLDTGYTFTNLPLTPRLGLKADVISGDGNLNDNRLETFNPLFPKLPYFNEANNIAPSNLLDLQPNLTLSFAKNLTVNVAWNPLWKQQEADAFYAPLLTPVNGTAGSTGRFIGQQASAVLEWQASEHLSVAATYVHFTPGNALKQAGGRAGDFVAAWAQYRF
jgi:hypothetical protein